MPRPLPQSPAWQALNHAIASCEKCPRLRTHCQSIAHVKRAAYRNDTYWAKPVPNLGPHSARLLILGLAPGAHGANRTGRLFTGDRSGDFLFAAMHATGFCNQPTSTHASDGLTLLDCAITGAAHCAPPDNKPTPDELAHCAPFLHQTLALMPHLRLILCLGKIAFDTALALYKQNAWLPPNTKRPHFSHGSLHTFPPAPIDTKQLKIENRKLKMQTPALLCSYHPSQQNTFTKKLTPPMLQQIFHTARTFITTPKN